MLRFVVVAVWSFWAGCGGTQPVVEEPRGESYPDAQMRQGGSGMEVTGIMGTIPVEKIDAALQPRLGKFQRCFFHGMEHVEFLSGHMKFYFRVGLDGRVEWVDTRGSSIGHRGTEQCLLTEAAKVHFPKPRGGGAAEFVWGFELDMAGGVRVPVAWDASRAAPAVQAGAGVLEGCGAQFGEYDVTAYVAPGGKVMSAGAASDSHESAAHVDCVVDAVSAWTFPDPGSYAAKVTFRLN